MKVFKFGGASVKDADAVRNVLRILHMYSGMPLAVVVSAMGKTTNALEAITAAYARGGEGLSANVDAMETYHRGIMDGLELSAEGRRRAEVLMLELRQRLSVPPSDNFDFDYDQIVSYGELISTAIVTAFLESQGVVNRWCDARGLIRTDHCYREGRVEWERTTQLLAKAWEEVCQAAGTQAPILLTQGFVGHTSERTTTTLGREGSDFTAAILAYCLQAESVTIWKDVPGVLNADPKYFKDAVLLKRISYREAIELAYFGATVIHPKTIKPLQNKGIPLYVKSFTQPEEPGTEIVASTFSDSLVPSYIFKVEQVLISFSPRDFSFIAEEHLGELFSIFARQRVRIHLMQNSALNFSICIDYHPARLDALLAATRDRYEVLYNAPCELVTIRHYDQETISRLLIGKKVLVEQRSRSTARMVLVPGG
jgi:aspartate kinase